MGGDDPVPQSFVGKQASPSHAVLWGRIEPDDQDDLGNVLLRGEWRHVQGPLEGGKFEMKVDSDGKGSGFWILPDNDESVPWQWSPSENVESEPLMRKLNSHEYDDDTTHALASLTMSKSGRLTFRESMSSRLTRGNTFFDAILDSEAASAVWIARWGILCAWIFLVQTALTLFLPLFELDPEIQGYLQCCFQSGYSVTYFSFLVIYSQMKITPPLDYVVGVVLYTIGYFCFF